MAILYKRGGAHYYFQNSLLTMGCGKDLTEEKSTIIKEMATGNAPGAIAKEIGRHVGTVKRFVRSPSKRKPQCDRGVLKSVTKHNFRRLRRSIRKMPGATSAKIFEEAGLVNVPKNHSQSSSQEGCSYQESKYKASPDTKASAFANGIVKEIHEN